MGWLILLFLMVFPSWRNWIVASLFFAIFKVVGLFTVMASLEGETESVAAAALAPLQGNIIIAAAIDWLIFMGLGWLIVVARQKLKSMGVKFDEDQPEAPKQTVAKEVGGAMSAGSAAPVVTAETKSPIASNEAATVSTSSLGSQTSVAEKSRDLNWRAGLNRLWVVASVLWLIGYGTFAVAFTNGPWLPSEDYAAYAKCGLTPLPVCRFDESGREKWEPNYPRCTTPAAASAYYDAVCEKGDPFETWNQRIRATSDFMREMGACAADANARGAAEYEALSAPFRECQARMRGPEGNAIRKSLEQEQLFEWAFTEALPRVLIWLAVPPLTWLLGFLGIAAACWVFKGFRPQV